MNDYIVIVRIGDPDDETSEKPFYSNAATPDEAEAEAIDNDPNTYCVAVYQRIR